jgi:hypothetical protein
LSFGLTHLNTVERRKIRSGSSAADATEAGHSTHASSNKARGFQLLSQCLTALDVMNISVGGVSTYVVRESPSERSQARSAVN